MKNKVTRVETVASAAGWDAGNRSAKGGTWSRKDYRAAVVEYHRIRQCPASVGCNHCEKA